MAIIITLWQMISQLGLYIFIKQIDYFNALDHVCMCAAEQEERAGWSRNKDQMVWQQH